MSTGNPFELWAVTVRAALEEVSAQDFGYPIDVQELLPPAAPPIVVPGLEPLYAVCDGLSAPDVHVGYFLHPAARVLTASERGEPTHVRGERITVFGSDGGGSRFALRHGDGHVLYLPVEGGVDGGTYLEDDWVRSREVGSSLLDFLERLAIDIRAFVAHDVTHRYLVTSD
jgi:hypothetical protein